MLDDTLDVKPRHHVWSLKMRNRDIPKLAFIEAQIMLDPRIRPVCQRIAEDIEDSYGLRRGALGDGNFKQTRTLSLLYLLILFPKEIWGLSPESRELSGLSDTFDYKEFEIDWGNAKRIINPHYELIHRIRNATAHARIDFESESIIFHDNNGFCVRMSMDQLSEFLGSVGAFLANMRSNQVC